LLLQEGNWANEAPRTIIVEDKGTTEICLMDFGISTAQQEDSDYNIFRFSSPNQAIRIILRDLISAQD
jgi:hypothetical protein